MDLKHSFAFCFLKGLVLSQYDRNDVKGRTKIELLCKYLTTLQEIELLRWPFEGGLKVS